MNSFKISEIGYAVCMFSIILKKIENLKIYLFNLVSISLGYHAQGHHRSARFCPKLFC
jgi:hypothetical protein